jgi:glycosyltransferase involved in cell wall biosynthesis
VGRLDGARRRRVVSAVMFFPRGGSAHVARALARELPSQGWDVTLVAGSRTDLGPETDARRFYAGLDLRAVDFTAALRDPDPTRYRAGPGEAPMHPSFEDRPGAPDVIFASLDELDLERHVDAWSAALGDAGAASADLLHLHHLTPLNEAAARVAPGVPVVGQVHGTELLMLEAIEGGPRASWRHAERWAERIRGWAQRCERLLVAPGGIARAAGLLGVDEALMVPTPNGFDPERFGPRAIDSAAHWQLTLVDEPHGWLPGEGAGSAAYRAEDLGPLIDGVVLLYVGRFTEVKRLPLLIRAFARAEERFNQPAGLVLLGGHPGEWEGEHPAEAIAASGERAVFLAGWHDHEELPEFLNSSDALVLASVREQFGQVLVEGMACELPSVAAESFGASLIVEDGETGWLVAPDDEAEMAEAIVAAVNDSPERRRRGELARERALELYSWPGIAARVAAAFDDAAEGAEPRFERITAS